jgi:aspartyl aminopeptidase
MSDFGDEFLEFLDASPTPYHYCKLAKTYLLSAGYSELSEADDWASIPDKFFFIRHSRSLVAVNKHDIDFGIILASHCDSPVLSLFQEPPIIKSGFLQMRTESYGGVLGYTWLDRDLNIAGKVTFERDGRPYSKIVITPRPAAYIPSVAAHLIGNPCQPKLESRTCATAIIGSADSPRIESILAELCGCAPEEIIAYDIALVHAGKPLCVGPDRDLIVSPRLDNLTSAFATLKAFVELDKPLKGLVMLTAFDNEEISSRSPSGARSTMIQTVLDRLGVRPSFNARSFVLSADVLHATHPTNVEVNETGGCIAVGEGLLYGWNQTRVFGTDNPELQVVREIARKAGIPLKPWVVKNSLFAGSTIGVHLSFMYGFRIVDLGVPLLGMHSATETGSIKDVITLYKLVKEVTTHYNEYE